MDGGQYVEASKMLNRAHNLAPEKADPIKGLQEVARQSGDVLHYCRYAEVCRSAYLLHSPQGLTSFSA